MNKLLSIALFFAFTISTIAQTVPPAKINFQAAVRNSSGQPLTNKTIAVQFKIKSGSVTGIDELIETYTNITTNSYGLFSIAIGTQSISSGGTMLDQLAWGSKDYFLVVGVDTTNGISFVTISSQQLITVPYAFHSATTDSLINFSLQKDAWTTKGNNILPGQYFGTNNTQDLIIKSNGNEHLRLFTNGSISFFNTSSNIIGASAAANAVFGESNNLGTANNNFVIGSNNKFFSNGVSKNFISGNDHTVNNLASSSTIIGGSNANLFHSGSLLLKDNSPATLSSSADDQYSARFKGGYRFFVDTPTVTVYTPDGNWGINDSLPTSSVYIKGSFALKPTNAQQSINLNNSQSIILIKNNLLTINLPKASTALGRIYIIKCPDTGSATPTTFTVQAFSGDYIDTPANLNEVYSNQSIAIFSDGNGWQTLKFQQ